MTYSAWAGLTASSGKHCQVSRGADGTRILLPVTRTLTDDSADHSAREPKPIVVGYRLGTVFDATALVSPPRDVPRPAAVPLDDRGRHQIRAALRFQLTAAGYRLRNDPTIGGEPSADTSPGVLADHATSQVWIRPDMPPAQQFTALVEETVHALLHTGANQAPTPEIARLEAASAAYLVMRDLGLDTIDDPSAPLSRAVPALSEIEPGLLVTAAERAITTARDLGDGVRTYLGLPPSSPPEPASPVAAGRQRPLPPDPPDTVTMQTRVGRWELNWRRDHASFTAGHRSSGRDVHLAGTPGMIPTLGVLEERLGFALPSRVREYLADLRRAAPPRPDTQTGTATAEARAVPSRLHPLPFGTVRVPGRPETTYLAALTERSPLRTWEATRRVTYRVEILSIHQAPSTGHAQLELTYRLSVDDVVVFSGDDVLAPVQADPAGDEAIREVVTLLTYADPEIPLTAAQQRFLGRHADTLRDLTRDPTPPYSPGTRITVTAPGDPVTGVITQVTQVPDAADTGGRREADADPTTYLWRPDTADLPGHPWHANPGNALVTAAEHVAPTLAGPDRGLTGRAGQLPLAYLAEVLIGTDDAAAVRATVLRTLGDADGSLVYHLRGDRDEVIRLPADQVVPVTGTAWPSIQALVEARDNDDIPLLPGEILPAGGQLARVDPGPDGIALTRLQPDAGDRLCATPDCHAAPDLTVTAGWPSGHREISDRCRPCSARLAVVRLDRGCGIDIARSAHAGTYARTTGTALAQPLDAGPVTPLPLRAGGQTQVFPGASL
jgi:hypothetical protein